VLPLQNFIYNLLYFSTWQTDFRLRNTFKLYSQVRTVGEFELEGDHKQLINSVPGMLEPAFSAQNGHGHMTPLVCWCKHGHGLKPLTELSGFNGLCLPSGTSTQIISCLLEFQEK
jgi:hypothetical protein